MRLITLSCPYSRPCFTYKPQTFKCGHTGTPEERVFPSVAELYLQLPEFFLREGNGTPLQYSCLENPMDGGAWWVAKSWTRLSDFILTFHFHALEKEMATHSVLLPGESQGRRSLVSYRLWGRTESDTTVAT